MANNYTEYWLWMMYGILRRMYPLAPYRVDSLERKYFPQFGRNDYFKTHLGFKFEQIRDILYVHIHLS
jgi:hypothetical protein